MTTEKAIIPVFFSCDDNYLPFLSVAIASLTDHAASNAEYRLYVLNDGLTPEKADRFRSLATEKVSITFVNVVDKIKPLLEKLCLRDYYTVSIYFRLFIPAMFPEYDKAIYLDADITVMEDIRKLYDIDLGNNLLGAVPDAIIASRVEFSDYAEYAVGVPFRQYFNSGVLLMNLKKMRVFCLEERFVWLLRTYGFDTICPDQDYLNAICRDRVLYLDQGWNKMSIDRDYPGTPMLIHYNMYYKPWLYHRIAYEEFFWQYAEKSSFLPEIQAAEHTFGWKGKIKNKLAHRNLLNHACEITLEDWNFREILFENKQNDTGTDAEGYSYNDYDEQFTVPAL